MRPKTSRPCWTEPPLSPTARPAARRAAKASRASADKLEALRLARHAADARLNDVAVVDFTMESVLVRVTLIVSVVVGEVVAPDEADAMFFTDPESMSARVTV